MAEKFAGKNILRGLMKNVLSVAPSSVLTEEDVQQMWEGLDTPAAPIEAWNYSLNDEESSVTLQQYVGSEENVTVYASYDVEAATYNTKIASNDDNSEDYMFAGNDTVQTVTFEEGVDTSETVNMSNMFASCMSLRSVNLSAVNTENTTSMANMFSDCESLEEVTVDAHNWVVNEECDTTGMFEGSPVTEETYVNEHEYDETDHCTTCGQLNPEHQHSYVEEITTEPTCESTGLKTFTCSVCGDSYTEEIPALGHDFGEFVTDVEATCDTAGSKSQHCSRCGAKQNVTEIPAWGHDYEEPTYVWSDDMTTCTASRTCTVDGHVDTETVSTVSEVTTEPGCESTGVKTYTAEFTNGAFAKQLKNETIDALGHSYVDGICTVCGAEDPNYVPPIEVAPDGELNNWNYTLDEDNKLVTLNQYTNTTATDVTVYGKYQLNGVEYDTKIGNNDNNSTNYMFGEKSEIKTITFKEGIDTSGVTEMQGMFYGCSALTSLDLTGWDTSNVTKMNSMFRGCKSLTSLDLTGWDTSNVTNMSKLFYNCKSLTSLDLTSFDTSNVTNMDMMFNECAELTSLDLTSFDTSNVTDMNNMFRGCIALTSLDLTSFDTSKVTNIACIFEGCIALTSLDLTSFDTSNVTDMGGMFYECIALTSLDLTSFDTSNVTCMNGMFYGCTSLTSLDLTSFDTSNVTHMYQMFYECTVLTEIKVTTGKWIIANGHVTADMFYNCGVSEFTYVDAA